MKKIIFAVLGVVTLSMVSIMTLSSFSQAEAQKNGKAPLILVVHQAQIIAQSKAGKSMTAQAETLQKSVGEELLGEKTKLEKDIESFQANSSLWSTEERNKKQQELAARTQVGLPQMGKVMEAAFVQAVRNAENEILKEASPIMQKIVEDRGATVLLDRSAIMYAAAETDITQEVIAKLDKKLKTVKVEQISLKELQRRAAEASKKAN